MSEITQFSLKYRPRKWEDIYGQDSIVKDLKKRVLNNTIPSAILFQGQYGTGKTTMAELFAACLQSKNIDKDGNPDWDEAECKSIMNGTFDRDTIRLDGSQLSGKQDVIEATQDLNMMPMYSPTRRKVLIIEECDQISNAGMMSLLKVLEGLKPYVTVILLSMENKVSKALKSRCQVYNVKPLSVKDMIYAMKSILEKEGLVRPLESGGFDTDLPIEFFKEGIGVIAEASKGSMRSACQFLEQCIVGQVYKGEEVSTMLSVVDETQSWKVLDALLEKSNDPVIWKFIMDSDAMELYNYMTLLLSEAMICKRNGFSYDLNNYDRLLRMGSNPNAENLYYCLSMNEQMTKPFLRTSDLLGALTCYLDGYDFRPHKSEPITILRETTITPIKTEVVEDIKKGEPLKVEEAPIVRERPLVRRRIAVPTEPSKETRSSDGRIKLDI